MAQGRTQRGLVQSYTTIGDDSIVVAQKAFLRMLRGEAYLSEAPPCGM